MASLSTLPNELLLLIFTACPSAQAAARLSEAGRFLHHVWRENTERIAAELLRPQIPAYDEAVKLAKYEAGADATPALWISQLVYNAGLARVVCDRVVIEQEDRRSDGVQNCLESCELDVLSASYFLLRTLVYAYSDVSLQQALCSALEESTLEEIRMHWATSLHFGFMEPEAFQRYEMSRSDETWGDWSWAQGVIRLLWKEKKTGSTSAKYPCPWRFGKVCCDKKCGRRLPVPADAPHQES